jgi:hypothetical protein
MGKLSLVIALVLLFGVSGYAQSETPESNSNRSSTNQESNKTNENLPGNKPNESLHPANVTSKDNENKTSAFSYKDIVDTALTFALLLVVIGQALIARRTARIYDQQREIMQRQVEHLAVIDRAYIEIVDMRMGALKVNEMVIVKTVFLNIGRSPAWKFRFRCSLIFLEKPQPLPDWLKPKSPRGKGRMLPAGREFVDESPSNFIFTREQVQAMVNKTAKLVLAGDIDYIDITGKAQPSSFIRLYDPETGTFNEYDQAEDGETK